MSQKKRESSEDYLERILMLQNKIGNVRAIDIAVDMGYSKPSVSIAMKKLKENNYILVNNDGFIALTEIGYKIAATVLERHQVLSEMLIALGVDKDIAYEDACKLEHDLSPESFEAIKNHFRKY